jgi:hypothetical protein
MSSPPSTSPLANLTFADSPEAFRVAKLIMACQHLLNKGLYLGSTCLCEDVKWSHVSRANLLIAGPTAHAKLVSALSDDTTKAQDTTIPAILSTIVSITANNFWMTSCGMWKGPNSATKEFADIKPTCTGVTTDHEFLAQDFSVGIDNICQLMEQMMMSDTTAKQGMLVNTGPGQLKLKFRHVLFQVC